MFYRTIGCLVAATTLLVSLSAVAAYPDKPVRIIVPNPPGGAVDVVTRKVAQKLSVQTGQSFVVENKPGASGTIGTSLVVNAPADGYTLLANDNSYTTLPYVFKKLNWDHQTALIPIAPFAFSPVVLGVKADSRFKDLASLISYAKAHPGEVTFGTGGPGSSPHFSAEAFQQAAGIKLMHVPYKGAGEAMVGLLSGSVDLLVVSTPTALAPVKGNQMRLLGISGKTRVDVFPGVPTFAEAGVPNFSLFNWSGLAAPKGTPNDVITRLQTEIQKALQAPDMKAFLAQMGSQPGNLDSPAFAQLIQRETAQWATVAQKAHIEKQ
ncbi:Tripartite-type tricarboxylate transporter, extracytoplasmic receptor component TctC [Cupriavidus necator]|uniref:Probable extra-cytoplasmic solute receptor n=1 Tax=Cupriavidus necator (strain ATCC 17699 / DSM 428 / KCTC 22496 / NCIMB 10442 / H16 / Stanier 337) TaxID=381666 RepID=Q0K4C8_CUPNH|nr:tripartite tricarboxylate transporter substrate binding protein [Cupriavidus necator]QCC03073.1 tripartite tricarboxylate transporter substrate binding protein [Cupriavidus necator H16]QQB80130.1 tripartite tricarboxylate transporter substrate binding protein [Cupriavidus necator]WKA44389.1 tripartite tricarboxylate transporter substrate binding protein [Cupriavidus necator]CAJ95146.1 probable extra-cytoplasmic solute receptor [Cupriavidus necator H16]